jgi:transcriptional regulator with XRE-family HTH domain
LGYNSFSAKVTAKVTAELLPLNDSDAHLALHLTGTFYAKGRAMRHQQTFGIWLRQRRKALDLTQAQLAQQAGCSLSAIRQFERSVLRPSRQLTEQLAEHLLIPRDQHPAFMRAARMASTPDDPAVSIAAPSQLSPMFRGQASFPVPATPVLGRGTIWPSCTLACFSQICACLVSPVHQGWARRAWPSSLPQI